MTRRTAARVQPSRRDWYVGGAFAGMVEISIPIPDELPHFDRDAVTAAVP